MSVVSGPLSVAQVVEIVKTVIIVKQSFLLSQFAMRNSVLRPPWRALALAKAAVFHHLALCLFKFAIRNPKSEMFFSILHA